MRIGYVFGYGSLADRNDWLLSDLSGEMVYGYLHNYRRTWQVALDNSSAQGKYYVTPKGDRYIGTVATLGLIRKTGAKCNGVAIPVDNKLLRKLDKREEGLYKRVPLSESSFSVPLGAQIWTYYPTDAARRLYKTSSPVLPENYLEVCRRAFSSWSQDGWDKFIATTDRLQCPLVPLLLYREAGWSGI